MSLCYNKRQRIDRLCQLRTATSAYKEHCPYTRAHAVGTHHKSLHNTHFYPNKQTAWLSWGHTKRTQVFPVFRGENFGGMELKRVHIKQQHRPLLGRRGCRDRLLCMFCFSHSVTQNSESTRANSLLSTHTSAPVRQNKFPAGFTCRVAAPLVYIVIPLVLAGWIPKKISEECCHASRTSRSICQWNWQTCKTRCKQRSALIGWNSGAAELAAILSVAAFSHRFAK